MSDIQKQWHAGQAPDFHVYAKDPIREGDRVVVIDGEHAGRFGRVVLTHDSDHHLMIALMLALTPDHARVMLDRTKELGSWSGVIPVASLKLTRMETDNELHARICEKAGDWGLFLKEAQESGGQALDDFARHLGLKRREVLFSGAASDDHGFPER